MDRNAHVWDMCTKFSIKQRLKALLNSSSSRQGSWNLAHLALLALGKDRKQRPCAFGLGWLLGASPPVSNQHQHTNVWHRKKVRSASPHCTWRRLKFLASWVAVDARTGEDAGAYVLHVSSASTASLFQNQLIYPTSGGSVSESMRYPGVPSLVQLPASLLQPYVSYLNHLKSSNHMPGCVNSIWNILSQAVLPVRLLLQVYVQYLSPLH
jgi:hypothetical protein